VGATNNEVRIPVLTASLTDIIKCKNRGGGDGRIQKRNLRKTSTQIGRRGGSKERGDALKRGRSVDPNEFTKTVVKAFECRKM